MNDDPELQARAIRMRLMLEDADIQAAFAEMEADIVEQWKACQDERERQMLWLAMKGLDKLQTWMRSAASYDLTAIRRMR
jgi:hypothetical protein